MTMNRHTKYAIDLANAGLVNPWAVDQKIVAERKWLAPMKARKEQASCDVGLFSDDAKQIDLLDLVRS